MVQPSFANLDPGAVFHGRYRIVRSIKSGRMGAVYEVVDDNTAGRRALKVMLPGIVENAEQRARFALEAKVTGDIESDHLVRVSDSGIDEAMGTPFIVMELLRGEELGDMLKRRGTVPAAEVVTFLSQTALALDKTHAAGIVHRDLKPGNLFVTSRDDGSPCVKIVDFGVAKVVAQSQAQKTKALGTPLYMAPEQIRGDATISGRADLYSLGQVAYTLLVGEAYWKEDSKGDLGPLLMKIMNGAVEPPCARARRRSNVELPPAFDAWFQRATSAAPEQRFERATECISALGEVLRPAQPAPQPVQQQAAQQPPPAQAPMGPQSTSYQVPAAAPASPARPSSALPIVLGISAVVVLGLVAVIVIFVVGVGSGSGAGSGAGVGLGSPHTCGLNMMCARFDIADPARVDMAALVPQAKQLAASVDKRATFIGMSCIAVKDGVVNIADGAQIAYQFGIPGAGGLSVMVSKTGSTTMRSPVTPFASPVPDPRCSPKDAWRVAVSSGAVASGTTATVMYEGDSGVPVWKVIGPKRHVLVDGKTCAVRK